MKTIVLASLLILAMSTAVLAETTLYTNAVSAYQRGDFSKSIQLLEKYVQQKPNANAYYLLGYAHYKTKNYLKSVKFFREAYIIDPKVSPASSGM
jgi:TolA-binding protein